ncbi:50S ribosomal protein L9 [Thermodesulfobacterium commune]|uniref:Large ribosomal subunit protein bL9 n=2 Tax=Thermodesulfobacterium commune TaxID=1741 RepID=A0A075WV11_9BACT|nr:50S ribosomal protein L9 [Thermodesulfobacterium commune]AIH04741.1 50S ribosomal protein L9 [Thermodesulfobacterium commune DSM 2178]
MEVILRTDVPKLGKAGDIVRVKDGYARNYLIPKGFAIPANQKNIKALEKERQIILAKAERERKKLMSLAEKLEGLELVIYRRKIEEDRIFGSVTVADIVSALKEKGFEVDKKFIELDQPIKKLGVYEIPVKFSPDRVVTIKLEVIEEK